MSEIASKPPASSLRPGKPAAAPAESRATGPKTIDIKPSDITPPPAANPGKGTPSGQKLPASPRPAAAPIAKRWQDRVNTSTGPIIFAGYLTIAVMIGGFGLWAVTAPIAGAAIAPGIIAAAGQNIIIQHLEGGIIREIDVLEGQKVTIGQTMIVLDKTAPETLLNRLVKQLISLQTKAARLVAERDGATELLLPEDFSARVRGADFSDALVEQQKEFDARFARYTAEREILNQRVAALEEAQAALTARKEAATSQLTLVREDAERQKGLLDQGLSQRSVYSALLRDEAELIGSLGQIQSESASLNIQAVEARQQIERATTARVEEAVGELNTVRTNIADIEEQMIQGESVMARTIITAPADGIILKMNYNTPGSVVGPGQPLLELLPTTSELIIEARVAPADVDAVRVGQSAKLRFSALNTRKTPEVGGTVFYVSADRLVDPNNGMPYYVVRLRITDELPPEIARDQIYPGMPVEAFIGTGERTFAEYLIRPILDSFNRAFREE